MTYYGYARHKKTNMKHNTTIKFPQIDRYWVGTSNGYVFPSRWKLGGSVRHRPMLICSKFSWIVKIECFKDVFMRDTGGPPCIICLLDINFIGVSVYIVGFERDLVYNCSTIQTAWHILKAGKVNISIPRYSGDYIYIELSNHCDS